MILVKVLERKAVIRFFGSALILAPAMNALLSMSLQQVENKWTLAQLSKVVGAQGFSNNVLSICSIILGLTMLSGSKKSWNFALGLLGIHVLMQIPKLGQDIRTSWIYGLVFLVNICTFLFIGDQLVFKQKSTATENLEPETKVEPVAMPEPTIAATPTPLFPLPTAQPTVQELVSEDSKVDIKPKVILSKQKILVSFEGAEPWAQLLNIDSNGVELKQLSERPKNLEARQVEITLGPHLNVKMKFSGENGNRLYFKYSNTSQFERNQLNDWLIEQASLHILKVASGAQP